MSLLIASLVGVLLMLATAADAQRCTDPPRTDGRCGSPQFNMARCEPGLCCSQYFWCGNTTEHCNPDICKEPSAAPAQTQAPSSSKLQTKRARVEAPAAAVAPTERRAPRGRIVAAAIPDIGPRVSITSLSPAQLTAYRDAWARIMSGGQSSIYSQIAQDHGIPNFYCPHGNEKFLPWHRRYIDRLEEALGMPLAYWDWTQGRDIPAAFGERTYVNSQGIMAANPLFAGVLPSGQLSSRRPQLTPTRFQAVLAFAHQQTEFSDFTRVLESVHDNVHGSVGRTMSMVSIAAFDPIFWGHHAFVDYQWWIWQLNHANAVYSDEARGPMEDSIGMFLGASMIPDQSGWLRGRSADQLPRASASSVLSEPQMILVLKNVPSLNAPTEISVQVEDFVLAKDVRFGMQGMAHRITKDYFLFVDPEAANHLWNSRNIRWEQIPSVAKVWMVGRSRDGSEPPPVMLIEGVTVEVRWTH